jgi:hypothetical protein
MKLMAEDPEHQRRREYLLGEREGHQGCYSRHSIALLSPAAEASGCRATARVGSSVIIYYYFSIDGNPVICRYKPCSNFHNNNSSLNAASYARCSMIAQGEAMHLLKSSMLLDCDQEDDKRHSSLLNPACLAVSIHIDIPQGSFPVAEPSFFLSSDVWQACNTHEIWILSRSSEIHL